jgi:hypothetical protein
MASIFNEEGLRRKRDTAAVCRYSKTLLCLIRAVSLNKIEICKLLLDTFADGSKSPAEVHKSQLEFMKQSSNGYSCLQLAIRNNFTGTIIVISINT